MREELFEELLEAVRQGGAILRGELKPSRVFVVPEMTTTEISERMEKHMTICQNTDGSYSTPDIEAKKPDYEDLWYTLYDYVLATGNRHIKRIMEEADPCLVEEEPGVFMPDREPKQ
jgi:hypothetical protein